MRADVKRRSTRFHSDRYHTAYGIQNWLASKGFLLTKGRKWNVDPKLYADLIKKFCQQCKGFDESKIKNFESYELFVSNRFPQFCKYCINRTEELKIASNAQQAFSNNHKKKGSK